MKIAEQIAAADRHQLHSFTSTTTFSPGGRARRCADENMNIQLTPEEIDSHLHPSSPDPGEYWMTSLTCFVEPERQIIKQVEVCLAARLGGSKRTLRFIDVWMNSLPGSLAIPEPVGSGILVVDIRDRGWLHPLIILADDDDQTILFGAAIMEEAQQDGGGQPATRPESK